MQSRMPWSNMYQDARKPSPGSGTHRRDESVSLDAIIAVFIPTLTTALIYLAIFSQIRSRYPHLYSSRTYKATVPKQDRTPVPGLGKYDWVRSFIKLDERFLLQHNSMDVYLFMRFLKTIVFLCITGCCITWPILLPVNATGGGESTGLDRLSFSNIKGKNRLYAHASVAWIFLGLVMFTIARERTFLREMRRAWYLTRANADLLSSRTVLFMHPAKKVVSNDNLVDLFGEGACNFWPVTNLKQLEALVGDRNDSAMSLEEAQVQYIRRANHGHLHSGTSRSDEGSVHNESRPTRRSYPVLGTKSDAIEWYRSKVSETVDEISRFRDEYDSAVALKLDDHPAIFVEYRSQALARKAYHQLPREQPLHLKLRHINLQPKEVIWDNLAQSQAERLSKKTVATLLVLGIIIIWAIPISILGSISNVNYLADNVSWLHWIKRLPPVMLGLLTGFVPPFLVSWVVSYVPKIYRKIARRFEPTTSSAELLAQNWYFAFQLIQVFLITTVTSGATAVAAKIAREPQSVPDLLAQNLPKASNFYLTYFILQGTASAAQNVLNYSDLFEYIGYDVLFDHTPRAKYERYMWMKGIGWCSVFPKFANFAVIAIAYSCIAPLTLGFAAAGVYLYYLSYRYNLLFVVQPKVDTKGDAYATALQHILVGVYICELCLIGLFSARKAPGPSMMMLILLVLTVFYHLGLNRVLRPLEPYLPQQVRPEDEEALLVNGEQADDTGSDTVSFLDHLNSRTPDWMPKFVLDFIERFVVPDEKMRTAMRQEFEERFADSSQPSEDQLKTAYTNPALTSKTPKLWLVRDSCGISRQEMEDNEKAGISSTDDGAELDAKNNLVWDTRSGGGRAPLFKESVRY